SVVLCAFGRQIATLINALALTPYLWLLPIGVAAVGLYQVLNYWVVRKQDFGRIARTKMSQGIGSACTQVGLGLLGAGVPGLIIGQIVGQCAGAGSLLRYFWTYSRPGLGRAVNMATITSLALRYRRFPQFSVVGAVVNAIGLQLTIIALNVSHGAEVTGWYALSQRALGMPLSLLTTATAQVTLGEAAARRRAGGGLEELFWRIVRQQALLGVPIIVLAPLCPYLFGL
ncbi:MAG: oligosaccharide flippase family protein, partial [Thermoleophilia bacterium]|nr:oligosaccharide flippase family protein [Thermoleophilia bacterium]